MATVKYSPDLQSKIRKTLRRLSKDLLRSGIALQDSDLHQEYLNAHAIERLTDLPWTQEEDSECSSSFATPLASGLMDTLYEDAFREEKRKWPRHDFVLNGRFYTAHHLASTLLGYSSSIYWEFTTSPWDTMERGKGGSPFYSSYYTDSNEQWRTNEFFQATGEQTPHLATLMVDGAMANPELRRSELFCAVELILWSMKLDKRHQYMTNPVFVYSISNCSLRVLQVHYDRLKEKLVVCTTSYLDLTEKKDDIIKQYLQWMFNTPTGETNFQATNGADDTPSEDVRTLGLGSARNSPISKSDHGKDRSPKNSPVTKRPRPSRRVTSDLRNKGGA